MKFLFVIFLTFLTCQSFAFNPVFVDNTGLKWSGKLSQGYTNGCVGSNGDYNGNCSWYIEEEADSEAQKACLLINGRLPTKTEYENLMKNFEYINYNEKVRLTKDGLNDMRDALYDMDEFDFYWTSTPIERVFDYPHTYMIDAFIFDAAEHIRTMTDRARFLGAQVRCVSR
jgi:hypothetical protein